MVYNSSLDDPDNMVGQVGSYFIILIIVVGTAGNVMVIMAVTTVKKLRTAHNVLIASLAFADFKMNTCIMPFYVNSYYHRGWNFNKHTCLFQAYVGTMLIIVSPFHIALIAVNRFIMIIWPGKSYFLKTKCVLLSQEAMVWILSFSIVLLSMTKPEWAKIDYTDQIGRCNYVRAESSTFINILFIAGFIFPSLVILVCYLAICFVIRKSQKRVSTHQAQNLTASNAMLNATCFKTFSKPVFTVETSTECQERINMPSAIISDEDLETIGSCKEAHNRCNKSPSGGAVHHTNSECCEMLVKAADNSSTESHRTKANKTPDNSVNLQPCINVAVPKDDDAVTVTSVEINAEQLNAIHAQHTVLLSTAVSIPSETTDNATTKAEEDINLSTSDTTETKTDEILQDEAVSASPTFKSMSGDQTRKVVNHRKLAKSQQQAIRSFRMMLAVFAAFAFTYLPFTIVNLADSQNEFSRAAYMITALFFWTGSCVNPIIYGAMNRHFRDAYISILYTVYSYLQKPINWLRTHIPPPHVRSTASHDTR